MALATAYVLVNILSSTFAVLAHKPPRVTPTPAAGVVALATTAMVVSLVVALATMAVSLVVALATTTMAVSLVAAPAMTAMAASLAAALAMTAMEVGLVAAPAMTTMAVSLVVVCFLLAESEKSLLTHSAQGPNLVGLWIRPRI